MSLTFSTRDQTTLLDKARGYTRSKGFGADAHAVGILIDGELQGALVLQHADGYGAEAHLGATRRAWQRRDLLPTLVRYACRVRGHQRILMRIEPDNTPMQIVALKAGARIVGMARGSVAGQRDAILFALTEQTAAWPPKQGRSE